MRAGGGVGSTSCPGATAHTTPQTRVALRVVGVVAVLGAAALATIASHTASTAALVSYLAKYSPDRLADGRVWTVPISAFLLGHPRMIGPTTFFVVLIFLPYALWRGLGRAAVAAMSGHVVSTLAVAAVVLPAAALGWTTASSIARALDYGASAALAACAGGLAVAIAQRFRALGLVVFVGVAGWFVFGLATVRQPMANVADVEHLVALLTGAAVEAWSIRRRTGSTEGCDLLHAPA
jgi:hypothetical protein